MEPSAKAWNKYIEEVAERVNRYKCKELWNEGICWNCGAVLKKKWYQKKYCPNGCVKP